MLSALEIWGRLATDPTPALSEAQARTGRHARTWQPWEGVAVPGKQREQGSGFRCSCWGTSPSEACRSSHGLKKTLGPQRGLDANFLHCAASCKGLPGSELHFFLCKRVHSKGPEAYFAGTQPAGGSGTALHKH